MKDYETTLGQAVYFPGEFEAIEEEFCGGFPTPLLRLAPVKRQRLHEYLAFPIEDRQKAFADVKDWANRPIAAALDRLKNPAKAKAIPAKQSAVARSFDAIGAWGEED